LSAGWSTLYTHLSKISVRKNQTIKRGQTIGYVESTGNTSDPHLHFEELYKNKPQKVYLHGKQVHYWGTRNYTSYNECH
jgi:murein DD-endopeptidase MepM/ murein hydrolase activator NlpD